MIQIISKITCDPANREKTLQERELDLLDAGKVFPGETLTLIDDRKDYGEVRCQTYGFLGNRVVMAVWADRAPARRVISMRYCHEREAAKVGAGTG